MRQRQIFFVILIIVALVTFLTQPVVLSQEAIFDFKRAYQDYLYNYNQYQTSHREYAEAKSAYLTYQTLTAKTEARQKALAMLQWRDKAIRTYLTALRLKLAETTGISDYEQTVLYLKLDEELNWYSDHQQSLTANLNLEEITQASQVASEQFPQSENLIYQTLGAILAGKEKGLRDQIQAQTNELKAKIDEIRQKGDKETSLLESWILETENKLLKSQEKQFAAQQQLTPTNLKKEGKQEAYNNARSLLRDSHQYLQEAVAHLEEIIREIKNAD